MRLEGRAGHGLVDAGADDRLGIAALEELEALRVELPRWRWVEHDASADGRFSAQHDAIAAGGHNGLSQPQLRIAAFAHHAREHVARPHVHGDRGRHRLELLERDVEPPAHRVVARLDERIAAPELRARDSREVDRDALARACLVDRLVVHLDAARAGRQARRLDAKRVARTDRARPEGAGDDGAGAVDREGAVDVEPRRAGALTGLRGIGCPGEGGAQLVEPGAGLGADRDRFGLGHELPRLGERALERLRLDRIGFRHGHDAAVDPEQPQDREVLVRLRPRALGGVDHEQEEVDPGGAGDHRAHEALVAGHVDHRQPPPVGKLQRRVAELDRDPTLLLLGQAVGVLPGQRLDEPGLAVVDVTRGAEDERSHERA